MSIASVFLCMAIWVLGYCVTKINEFRAQEYADRMSKKYDKY